MIAAEEMVTSTPMTNRRLTFLRRGAATNTPENFLNESNDEAERTERRRSVLNRSLGAAATPVTNDSTNALSQDELKSQLATFYKLFQENKINATNVWNLKVIDCLKQLVKSSSTNDVLKIAGSSLEVAGKVYGIRVDDLHSDALKLASHWARVFASKHNKDDDNNDGNPEGAPDEEGRPKKKKQTKKRRFGLANNKQHILCSESSQLTGSGKKLPKLESDRFSVATDPKLSSCENLLTNKLRMNNSGAYFSMWGTEKSWHYYGDSFDASVKQEDNKPFSINLKSVEKYRLCPIDFRMDQWFPDETSDAPENLATTLDPLVVSAAGIPIAELDCSAHDVNDMGSDSDDIEEENAVEQAPLYRTDLPFVVDFAPSEDSSTLTNMTNTAAVWRQSNLLPGPTHQWAGPEHWKYKGLKNNPLIYTGKENEKPKRQSRTKKTGMKKDYEPLDLNHLKPPVDFSTLPPLKKSKLCINVDPAKLRLPLCLPDLSFRELMEDLNCLSNIPTIRVRPFTDNINGGSNRITANNTNDDQTNATFPDNDGDHDGDDLADDIFGNVEPMDVVDEDRLAPQEGETEMVADFVGDNLIDAPEMVEPVDLKYATKAKKTNMKKLKKDVWCILTRQDEYNEAAKVIPIKFWEMSKLVEERHGTEDSSIPLIFVSLLHITNEQNLVLKQMSTCNNFEISGPNF